MSRLVAANGIELAVTEAGEGPAVVLCHGFPELGYSWRHQVPALAAAGHRVIVPDLRGFGGSSRPAAVDAYDIERLGGDILGLLDALTEDRAVLVGHDWGATVCWYLAAAYPERIRAVAGLSVPFVRRPPVAPMAILRKRFGEHFYQQWFQAVGPAEEALANQIRRTVLADEEWTAEWAAAGEPEPVPVPDWITEEELAVFVGALRRTGFGTGLNYYRNIDRNWELTADLADRVPTQPAAFVTGSEDIARRFLPGEPMRDLLPDLREFEVIAGAGHWIQQERPAVVNAVLLRFLAGIDSR